MISVLKKVQAFGFEWHRILFVYIFFPPWTFFCCKKWVIFVTNTIFSQILHPVNCVIFGPHFFLLYNISRATKQKHSNHIQISAPNRVEKASCWVITNPFLNLVMSQIELVELCCYFLLRTPTLLCFLMFF